MTYIGGFVITVPEASNQMFIDHATTADSMCIEMGAIRVIECWAEDVPDGTLRDFRMAVKDEAGKEVVFSWIEWPDKATRDKCDAAMKEPDNKDPRMDMEKNPMPFDSKRMIWGGCSPVVDMKG